jgi:hypothetical protein
MPEFDKWWNDLKKHRKRLRHWLPHWKALAERIGDGHPLRYFTLCARSMIDVFMLVREGILEVDLSNNSICRVQFCECDQEQFDEIREMIAREDAGFFGRLEQVVLFEDDDFSGQFPTMESISLKLEDEGLQADLPKLDKLLLKQTFFNVKASFPYDCVNLDFCSYYYPKPPGMLHINRTVERFLDWQRRPNDDGTSLSEFVLAVTCKHDSQFPQEAETRLTELIRSNCAMSPEYKEEIEKSRGTARIEDWATRDREDFFFAGWPKDIARSAKDLGWSMEVLDYVYYRRLGDANNEYVIACLVAKFSRANPIRPDVQTALFALKPENRQFISEIDRGSAEGQQLVQNLETIVVLHNEQARRKQRPELPSP